MGKQKGIQWVDVTHSGVTFRQYAKVHAPGLCRVCHLSLANKPSVGMVRVQQNAEPQDVPGRYRAVHIWQAARVQWNELGLVEAPLAAEFAAMIAYAATLADSWNDRYKGKEAPLVTNVEEELRGAQPGGFVE